MASAPSETAVNINGEKLPLIGNGKSKEPKEINSSENGAIEMTPSPDNGKGTEDTTAPCAKYGNEGNLTQSALNNTKKARRKLIIASILCLMFLVAEFVGGYMYILLASLAW